MNVFFFLERGIQIEEVIRGCVCEALSTFDAYSIQFIDEHKAKYGLNKSFA